jgi:hypothetical protein
VQDTAAQGLLSPLLLLAAGLVVGVGLRRLAAVLQSCHCWSSGSCCTVSRAILGCQYRQHASDLGKHPMGSTGPVSEVLGLLLHAVQPYLMHPHFG